MSRELVPAQAFEDVATFKDGRGERVVGTPFRMQHVLATLYQTLGIDPGATFRDYNGCPQYVLESREPIKALI